MKLHYAPTSPYVRKVRMVAIEKGLADGIELIATNPFDEDSGLRQANPLGKVPALIRGDGPTLFDSPLICAYLDSLTETPQLIPAEGPARWEVLRREALCDGILDAAVSRVFESRREDAEISKTWTDRWTLAINAGVDLIESDIASLAGELRLDQLALGAALGYLDFRLPDLGWRDGRPGMAAWYEAFAARPAMQETAPPPA